MQYYRNGFFVEYILGHTYVNVYAYTVDEFDRLANMELVFRNESTIECDYWCDTHNINDFLV